MKARKLQRGFGLVEVLVALLIVSIGLLGIASLQVTALKNVGSSMERSQAVIQTYSYLDFLRANIETAKIGRLDVPLTCDPGNLGKDDDEEDDEEDDMAMQRKWLTDLQATLGPLACGGAECNGYQCTITIRWDDSRAEGGSTEQELITEAHL